MLDLKDADIHNGPAPPRGCRLAVNIVTAADDVSGNITIRMRNVRGTKRSTSSLQAKGLGMIRSAT